LPALPNISDPFYAALFTLGALFLADWGLGIVQSLRAGNFDPRRLPDQLAQIALPYLTPIAAAVLFAPSDWHGAIIVASASIAAKLVVEIKDKITVILAPVPAVKAQWIEHRLALRAGRPPV